MKKFSKLVSTQTLNISKKLNNNSQRDKKYSMELWTCKNMEGNGIK